MAAGITAAKRFIVRTALITGSSLATIFGAQNLIMLDMATSDTTTAQVSEVQTTTTTSDTTSVVEIRSASDSNTVVAAATAQPSTTTQVVTQPVTRTTRSSR